MTVGPLHLLVARDKGRKGEQGVCIDVSCHCNVGFQGEFVASLRPIHR